MCPGQKMRQSLKPNFGQEKFYFHAGLFLLSDETKDLVLGEKATVLDKTW